MAMKDYETSIFQGHGQSFLLRSFSANDKPDLALVEVEACTLCSSDLHTVSGRRTSPTPSVLGHEAIGRLVQLPTSWNLVDVAGNRMKLGQRLVWGVAASCGNCLFCHSGIPQKCQKLVKYGHSTHQPQDIPRGGLSELVEIVPGTPVVALSESIPAGLACLSACAGATVAAVIRQCVELKNRCVLVLGGGVLGVIACRMAAKAGAAAVICLEPDADRRQRAVAFGASLAVSPHQPDTADQIRRACHGGLGADFALDFSGANSAFEMGLASLRTGGLMVLAGAVFPSGSVAIEPEQIVRRMLTIQGMHNYAPIDLQTAVEFLESEFRLSPELWAGMIGEQFRLNQLNEAFQWAALHPGIRALIAMQAVE